MSAVLYECVPNFSEGRRPDVLDAIRAAAQNPSVAVLGLDSDPDHNRSVLTLIGPAEPLLEAVWAAARVAVDSIDLTQHRGTHPRIGAVDVVPFIPWRNASMASAAGLARRFGERMGGELGVPVFLYGQAATQPERARLATIRRGQFESLRERLHVQPPDFGPRVPHPTAGAVAVGARRLLIAFNVYLATRDVHIARQVARAVRGSSGGLVGVQALAMDTRARGRVQVSMNLVDYRTTSLPQALEMVRREAERLGVAVCETEVVGLMPWQAVEDVVHYYAQMPGFAQNRVLELAYRNWEMVTEEGS
jgi:glutamate formiminotransferase